MDLYNANFSIIILSSEKWARLIKTPKDQNIFNVGNIVLKNEYLKYVNSNTTRN